MGLELGQAFSRFGVRVAVIEAMERIVPTEDPDISESLTEALRAEGIEIHAGVKVTRVLRDESDIIAEAVLAVRFGLTTRDVVSTLHPYLTWAEGLKLAAQTFTKDVAKLSCCA
ncbi:MAG: NAD-binding protein [Gemmatimonadota bacterium]